jgi:hypothetical protein
MVKAVPFSDRLISYDTDTSKSTVDIEHLPDVELETEHIITLGSYTLAQIATRRGWTPGAWIDNLSYDRWGAELPAEWLLNPSALICKLSEVSLAKDAFIRPVLDSKSFSGKVFSTEDWHDFTKPLLSLSSSNYPLHAATEVIVSDPVEIWTETRCFVVGGQVVSASFYKRGCRVIYEECTDSDIMSFANQVIEHWQPSAAYVLDIAQTPGGFKVIEYNCINAAGFYATNVPLIIAKLTQLADR